MAKIEFWKKKVLTKDLLVPHFPNESSNPIPQTPHPHHTNIYSAPLLISAQQMTIKFKFQISVQFSSSEQREKSLDSFECVVGIERLFTACFISHAVQ